MTDPTTHSAAFAGWPIERIVPALAAGVTATGLILGELHAPQWRLLSAFAAANLALYAAAGWCPAGRAAASSGREAVHLGPPEPAAGPVSRSRLRAR